MAVIAGFASGGARDGAEEAEDSDKARLPATALARGCRSLAPTAYDRRKRSIAPSLPPLCKKAQEKQGESTTAETTEVLVVEMDYPTLL